MLRFSVVLLVLLLSSCASIPLGTMFEFRSFGKADLINIQPQQIRVRVQVDEPVQLDIEDTELTLKLNTENDTSVFNFPLVLLDERAIAPVQRLFSTEPGKTEYSLKLSAAGQQTFITAQQAIQHEESGNFNFMVSSGFESLPEDVTEIRLSIFLKLSEERGFVTLFKNAKLDVTHES